MTHDSLTPFPVTIFWFRRDLRLFDNAALWAALKAETPVLPIFIFDQNIIDKLENKRDARVLFIHQGIAKIKKELEEIGSSLEVFYGRPLDVFRELVGKYQIKEVYANRDYEPYAKERDKEMYEFLSGHNIAFKFHKDHVIFEKDEVTKDDKNPYTVFTPYSKKWKSQINDFFLKSYPTEKYQKNFLKCPPFKFLRLEEMGLVDFDFEFFPDRSVSMKIVEQYDKNRDFPGIRSTSHLGLHLRFGTVSIRQLCNMAIIAESQQWLNELIWRDFYQMIIHHFPYSANQSFKPNYDRINWRNDEKEFQAWCEGKTGYPIVDAGMRELNTTGFMHNRARMIVASFLSKHLMIDWRLGEKYFAEKLLDYELASNVGGWQWVVGSGCDGAPYFRIFNPESQTKRFDPEKTYIKKWVPEFESESYPKPIVDHNFARKRCLEAFGLAMQKLPI